jgi:chromatin structure-remodeling complex subunit RSC1/2
MKKLWDERTPPLPPFANLMRPGTLGPMAGPSTGDSERKAKRIKIKSSSLAPPHPETPTASGSTSSGRITVKPRPAQPQAAPATPSSNPPITFKLSRPAAPYDAPMTPSMQTPLPALPPVHLTMPAVAGPSGGAELPPAPVVIHETRKDKRAREKLAKMMAKAASGTPGAEQGEPVSFAGIPDADPGWLSGDMVSAMRCTNEICVLMSC